MYTIFKELCDQKGVTPYRVAKDTGIGRSTFTDWKKGRTPRADKLKKLADYFGVSVEVFFEDVPTNGQQEFYYLDEETREIVDLMHKSPKHKVLFSASRKLKPEDLAIIEAMIERMT